MEEYQEDLGGPASGATMSTTFLATFFVIALLVGGVSLFWHLTGPMVPEMIASVDPAAQVLSAPQK
jgi:hypothetical protein